MSAQRTSCQSFFSSPLYVHEFFWHDGLVQEFFSYAYALAGYFFSKSPTPPPPTPSEVEWSAPKRRRQAIKYQCWCGVNFPRDLKCQILSSLTLEIAFKRRKGFCGCGPKLHKDLTAVEEIRLVTFTMFSHRKVQTVSVFIINGFVYCSIFVY